MRIISLIFMTLLAVNVATASSTDTRVNTPNEASTPAVERIFTISKEYTGLKSSNGLHVEYSTTSDAPDGKTICKVIGPSELVKRVKVEVRGSTLHIGTFDSHGILSGTHLKNGTAMVIIYGRQINDFKATSGSTLIVGGDVIPPSGNSIIEAGSGGKITMFGDFNSLICKNLTVEMSSGGMLDIYYAKISNRLKITASSGAIFTVTFGEISSGELEASSGAILDINAVQFSGKVKVNASSGAIVQLSAPIVEVTKSSGAIVSATHCD